MTEPAQRWANALLALKLLALEPRLGGIALRARSGPVRDRWTAALGRLTLPLRKVPLSISNEQLFGGLNLAATLEAGREIKFQGLLATPSTLLVPMAERMEPNLAARLGQALDTGEHMLVAYDEGADDERLPEAIQDRLAFPIDLEGIACGDALVGMGTLPPPADVKASDADITAIAELCESLGVSSLRAAIHCLRSARAHAMLHRRRDVTPEDIEAAAILTLAPRATRMPEPLDEDTPPPPPPPDGGEAKDHEGDDDRLDIPQELLLEAVRAALPTDILAQVAAKRARRGAKGSGAGAKKTSNRRGRPLPSRAGRLDERARLDLVATLRAAAPWQAIRKENSPVDRPLEIRTGDIRLKRFEEKSDRLLIFAVDASGSAALARLAEAKGAIELLLAEAYARRDHVALVSFRGAKAEVLLPPTRSLVQTKRRLAGLPGGGGTPLATGLQTATEVAMHAKARGMTPTLILLTDGRANVALDGEADRQRAAADATKMAQVAFVQGIEALVIDVSKRPERALRTLAETLDGTYLPLPRADATKLSTAVTGALG
ncbi:MAG: magnesium chelatase subunit D [Rhodobacteraceae bacterium]|nr:magnesium chelatase subunit D [Paracoccaceae bacterium]